MLRTENAAIQQGRKSGKSCGFKMDTDTMCKMNRLSQWQKMTSLFFSDNLKIVIFEKLKIVEFKGKNKYQN